jgi:Fe-Mn family superoxide dismutase
MWGVKPILALDTYEHAYFADFGVNRAGYVDAFLDNLDWKKIEERFEKIYSCCQGQCKTHNGQ